ncbi:MAG: MBL fold metallo-hydrolase [Candidatus Symbiothrix sp.]|jgi:glyoxylase-like metal-dependent hydrolase (beta-lactamase superfamily II)|nr:MBL fold metallo-hydrolase [Candidatus Symbiothrix sp.]
MKKQLILLILIGMTTISVKAQSNSPLFSENVGDYKVYLLSEGQQKGNTGILIGATPEMIAEQIPEGTFPNASNAFLIQTPDKNILVDTGFGRLLFDNLESIGLDAKQIDVVLITHMHGDHIGGLLKDGQIAFPNADLYIAQPEHDYWVNQNNAGAINVINAYKKQLNLFEPNELENIITPLLPGITPVAAYGHTPGHTVFLVESNEDKLLIWGDLTHAMAIQMPYPQVAVTYDVNPEEAVQSREVILKYVAENKIPIAGMHIAYPAVGEIKKICGKGYEFIPR